ncbi:hypothetical protein GF359_03195 [candidate division WOR-3 bacterium]|uniref:Uncharacterized protein n=1 Tax=candidate division WOR-3 bacterium TaxID=2052148 RepID=A0A9D5K868_UNCW3|nr:hypothetical protein [candidate division WOR-3 bacterium]MBD3364201.1 hypothetical protein [candidate division WOR-3 bacterium]
MDKTGFGRVQAGARPFLITITLFSMLLISFGHAESYYLHRPDPSVNLHGEYTVGLHIFPQGGLTASLCVGFFDRFQIGLSYGGENIVGSGRINWSNRPGIQLKVAVLDEEIYRNPLSLAVGFDSQEPPGSNLRAEDEVGSPGFYLVAGRLFNTGIIGFDIGMGAGYEIFDEDQNEDPLHFYAVSGLVIADVFTMTPELTVYPQRNPDDESVLNLGLGFKWDVYDGLKLEFLLADLLTGMDEGWTRSLRFQTTQEF